MFDKIKEHSSKMKPNDKEAIRNAVIDETAIGIIPIANNIHGYYVGKRKGHPVTGAIFGTAGAYGSEAKDTGRSTLVPVIAGGAIGGATLGTLGAFLGGLKKIKYIPALAAIGGINSGIGYGAGYLFGKKRDKKKKLKKK